MLESSKDILYIVIAFSVLWLTIFLCWMIYYLAMMFKNANEIIQEIRDKIHGIAQALDFIRDKIEFVSGGMNFISKHLSKSLGITDILSDSPKKSTRQRAKPKKPPKKKAPPKKKK